MGSGDLEHGPGCVCDAGFGCILDGGAPHWAAAQQKGGDPISVAPVAPVSERRWCINSLGVKVWETDLEYTQRTGDPAPVAPMRPGAEYVCDLPGYVPGSITDLLSEVTVKAFARDRLRALYPNMKPLTPSQIDVCETITKSAAPRVLSEWSPDELAALRSGGTWDADAPRHVGVDMAKPGSDESDIWLVTWGEETITRMMPRGLESETFVREDRAMAMRDGLPTKLPCEEPYPDVWGSEFTPRPPRAKSWLNTSTSYRAQCMVGQ